MAVNSVIYQWSPVTSQYVLHQSLPSEGAQAVRVFVTSDGTTHMAIANTAGQSAIYDWNAFNSRFDLSLTSDPAYDIVPVEVGGQTAPLLAAASYGAGGLPDMSVIYHMTSVAEDADFVPW